jgi:hypothetical protein
MRTSRNFAGLMIAAVVVLLIDATAAVAQTAVSQVLQLEVKIPLGDVRGRPIIDGSPHPVPLA